LPSHGNFKDLLQMRETAEDLLKMIEDPTFEMYDQWQAQSQALVQRKAQVYLYSSLDPKTVSNAMLTPTNNIEATLAELISRYGPTARVAVLPEGPQTVPYVGEVVA
jgi:nickel-dependent lactate racemase